MPILFCSVNTSNYEVEEPAGTERKRKSKSLDRDGLQKASVWRWIMRRESPPVVLQHPRQKRKRNSLSGEGDRDGIQKASVWRWIIRSEALLWYLNTQGKKKEDGYRTVRTSGTYCSVVRLSLETLLKQKQCNTGCIASTEINVDNGWLILERAPEARHVIG